MRTDPLQVRTEIIPDVTDLVASLSGGHEEILALGDVARLLDLGT